MLTLFNMSFLEFNIESITFKEGKVKKKYDIAGILIDN